MRNDDQPAAASAPNAPPAFGFAEPAALVLLALSPLVYLPGFTYEFTWLKLPMFQAAAIAGLTALVLRGWTLNGRKLLLIPAAALVAWMFASLAWHRFAWAAPETLVRESSFLLGFIALGFLLSQPSTRRLYARWLAAASVVAAVFIIVFLLKGELNYFGNRNFAGAFLVLPLTAMLAYVLGPSENVPGRRYWMMVAAVLVLAIALWMTDSDGARAGAALGLALVCFLYFRSMRPWLTGAAVLAVVAAVGLLIFKPELVRGVLGVRADIWSATLRLIGTAPLLGQGAGGYAAAIRPFQSLEYFARPEAVNAAATLHAHSYPLEIFAELGIAGLVLYAGFLAALAIAAMRAVRRAADAFDRAVLTGISCGLAGMVLNGLVAVGPSTPDVQIAFWAGAAFICGAMAGPAAGSAAKRRLVPAAAAAVVLCAAFLVLNVNAFRAQRLTAVAVRQQQPEASLEILNRAAKLRPFEGRLSFAIRMRKAAACFATDDLPAAWKQYMQIEELSPNFGGIDADIAHVSRLLGERDTAAEYARRAAESNPYDMRIYPTWLAALKGGADASHAQRAAELLQKAEALKPFEAAIVRLKSRQPGQPFDVPFFYYAAAIPRSHLHRAQFLTLADRRDDARRQLVQATNQCARLSQVVTAYRPAVDLFSLWKEIADAADRRDFHAQAAKCLMVFMESASRHINAPAPLDLPYLLGYFSIRSGDTQRGETLLKLVAASCQNLLNPDEPDYPPLLELLAKAYEPIAPDLSLEIARKLLEQDPANQAALGIVRRLGKPKE